MRCRPADATDHAAVDAIRRELLAARSVHEWCVLEASRRGGIGSALAAYIERWARARSLDRIELDVWGRTEPAVAFYRALGFEVRRYELARPCTRTE